MKKYILSLFIAFLWSNVTCSAQQIGFRPLSFLGIANTAGGEYFYDGGGFELFYQHDVWKGRISGGVEYRIINWGNQVGLNLGYNLPFWQHNNWRASATLSIQGGLALFFQKSLGVFAVECIPEIEWQSQKRFFAVLGLGLRFSNSPAYIQYGKINSVLDIPIKIGIGFRLGKKST